MTPDRHDAEPAAAHDPAGLEGPDHVIDFDPRVEGLHYALSWDHLEPAGMHGEITRVWLYAADELDVMTVGIDHYHRAIVHGHKTLLTVHCGSIVLMDLLYTYLRQEAPGLLGTFRFRVNNVPEGLQPAPRKRPT